MGEGSFNIAKGKKIKSEEAFHAETKGPDSKKSAESGGKLRRRKTPKDRTKRNEMRQVNISEGRLSGINTPEGILEFLENLSRKVTADTAKERACTYLEKAKDILNGKLHPRKIGNKKLEVKLKQILKQKGESAKNATPQGATEEPFDVLGSSEEATAKQEAESVTASTAELSVPSSSAEVKPPIEAEVDPSEPDELDVDSLGVEVVSPKEGAEIRPEAKEPEKEPKPKKPEEGPEEKEKKAQERQDKLAQLKVEIDKARKEYLEDEYKKTKSYARLGNFFGKISSILKDDSGEAREEYKRKKIEEDSDLAQYRAYYDNKLFEYKNLLLEDAKEKGVSNKELGELVKVFAVEANMNMDSAHTEVRMENHSGRISENLKNLSLKMIDSYNKLPRETKWAIGLGFFGVGVLTGAAGLGASAWASATVLRRFFMGAVTGTSVTAGLESWGRGNAEGEIEKVSGAFSDKLEHLTNEQKIKITQEAIGKIIYDDKNSLNQIKSRKARNLAAGVGIAALLGTSSYWIEMLKHSETAQEIFGGIKGGVGKVMAMLGNQEGTIEGTGAEGVTDNNPEYPGYQDDLKSSLSEAKIPAGVGADNVIAPSGSGAASSVVPSAAGVESHVETSAGPNAVYDKPLPNIEPQAEAPVEPASENPINMETSAEVPDSDTVAEVEVSTGEPVKIEFEPGDNVEISGDDHMEYQTITGEDATESANGEVPETEVEIADSETDSAERTVADKTESLSDEQPDTPQAEQASEIPEGGTGRYIMEPARVAGINVMESNVAEINQQIAELDDKILKVASGQYESVEIWPSPERMLDELRGQKQLLEQAKDNWLTRIYGGYVGSVRRLICGGAIENWEKIGKIPANELLDRKSSVGYKFFARVMDSHSPKVIELQRHISPLKGENVDEWIKRIAKIMNKTGIKKI